MNYSIKIIVTCMAVTSLLYSCTMANSQYIKEEPQWIDVDYNSMSIGDTSIFSPSFIASHSDLSRRKIILRDHSFLTKIITSENGKIYVNTCINQAGESVFVSIDKKNTTIENEKSLASALNMIARYRFEKDTNAPQYECGVIKLFLDINAFR